MEGVKEISGIPIIDTMKYLGIIIFCDRQKTIKSIKDHCKKYMGYLKGRLQTKNASLR
jgi:predicted transcriptional regulator